MPLIIVPYSIDKFCEYFHKILKSKNDYDEDDINWVANIFISNYDGLSENAENLYTLLTITNQKIFSGYFSMIYNSLFDSAVKSRDQDKFTQLLYNPVNPEITENTLLTPSEKQELTDNLRLEILTTNLSIKKILVNPIFITDIESLFYNVYNELFNKKYNLVVKKNRADFEDFITIEEVDITDNIRYAYTYTLFDFLRRCIDSELSVEIIEKFKPLYETEVKLIEYNRYILSE